MNTRITDVLHQMRLFFVPYMVILACCLLIKLLYTREEIYFTVNAYYTDWGDIFFTYATEFGEGIMVIAVSLYFLLYSYRKALLTITSFAFTGILVQVVKHIVQAPRPSVYFVSEAARIHYVNGVHLLSNNSFPSGHTVTAFTAAAVLSYLAVNKRTGFLFLLLAIMVAYSRMYLSQHFFEDVTAGSIIGTLGTIVWVTWMDNRPFMHSQKWNKGLLRR